jgi:hypothetical protein
MVVYSPNTSINIIRGENAWLQKIENLHIFVLKETWIWLTLPSSWDGQPLAIASKRQSSLPFGGLDMINKNRVDHL